MTATRTARCACGAVEIEVLGEPILTVACYCDDCQEAGRRFAAAGIEGHLRPDGGTEALMMRRDRARIVRGAERLEGHRLKPGSKTHRVVAACCGTALLIDFAPGHWIDLYRATVPDAPPVNQRTMTKFAPGPLPDDGLPSPQSHDARFFARLLAAWPPMWLNPRAPRLRWPLPPG